MKDPIVIVSAMRTPMGNFQGELSSLVASDLGAAAIAAAMKNTSLEKDAIDEVIMGCVLPAGQGQAPARQAALKAGLAQSTPATTINKMCGSGMKAIMQVHDALIANSINIGVAGGMESMSLAPYLLPKARVGYYMGHQKVIDHMFYDGLEDAYSVGKLMGVFAENTAKEYGFDREMQDAFAIESIQRAQKAIEKGYFKDEITAITYPDKNGDITIVEDEGPSKANIAKIPTLKPAFAANGTVTAATSSSISDGAAALILMRQATAESLHLKPLARIVAHATHAHAPEWFSTAPVEAIHKVLKKAQWSVADVDLFEINEAFAVVTLVAMKLLQIPHNKVNVHGGACILGHPIGASGARIMTTLIHALKTHHKKRGVGSLCIGGGEATAMAVELCE
jgi:acetyl-CoA C-acetyltransferase